MLMFLILFGGPILYMILYYYLGRYRNILPFVLIVGVIYLWNSSHSKVEEGQEEKINSTNGAENKEKEKSIFGLVDPNSRALGEKPFIKETSFQEINFEYKAPSKLYNVERVRIG